MVDDRSFAAAALLNDGTVLLAGGGLTFGGGEPVDTAETYDPSTGMFTATANNMSVPRANATATLLKTGMVLVTTGTNTQTSADLYNPITRMFTPTGPLNVARQDSTATLLQDGDVLIVGGSNSVVGGIVSSAELYDPTAATFTLLSSTLAHARAAHTATLLNDGEVLIAGGTSNFNSTSAPPAQEELYDPTTLTFSTTGALNTHREAHSAVLLEDGNVLLMGGVPPDVLTGVFGGAFPPQATCELYNPATGEFTYTAEMNSPRAGFAAVRLANGNVLAAGGVGDYTILSGAEIYTPVSNSLTLVSIAITPTAPSIPAGDTQAFAAIGTYSDTSTQNITSTVTWTSSDTAAATIVTGGADAGVATGVAAGTSTITAALSGVTSNSATLTVTPATLASIAVTPATASIAAGNTQAYTATGTYSDSSTQNITSTATWASSNTSAATIVTGGENAGVATGVAAGTSTITAALSGITSNCATLTVTAATLKSIAVTPTTASIPAGNTQAYTATGTYSNSSTQNITSTVAWASSDTGTATIVTGGSNAGIATGVAAGTTTITAALTGITSNSGTLTVTAAAPVATTLTYTGSTTFTDGSAGVLSATLKQTSNSAAISGATISFTLGTGGGAQNCTGATNSAGTGTCTIPSVNQTVGSSTVSASFAGNSTDATSSTGAIAVTITAAAPVATTLTYTGPTTITDGSAGVLSATLKQTSNSAAISGAKITFTLGAGSGQQTCSSATNSAGSASCTISTVNQTAGSSTVSASFAGDSTDAASSTGAIVVTISAAAPVATTLTYSGPTTFTDGTAGNLSAVLKQTSSSAAVPNVTISFSLGSGSNVQTCTGMTNSSGTATCTIATVNQPAGSSTVSASFAGNSSFLASNSEPISVSVSTSSAATKLTYTGPRQFTIGGAATLTAVLTQAENGDPIPGQTITFAFTIGGFGGGGNVGQPQSAAGAPVAVQLCTAVTNSSGTASCIVSSVVPPTGTQVGSGFSISSVQLLVSFAGSSAFLPSSAKVSVQFPTSVSGINYLGVATFTEGVSATFSAAPFDAVDRGDLEAGSFTFTLGTGNSTQACGGIVRADGVATCSIREVTQPLGPDTLTIAYSGTTEPDGHVYLPATVTVSVTILPVSTPATTLTYSGPTTFTNGQNATLSAVLRQASNGTPISGQLITFTLAGSGYVLLPVKPPAPQVCTGTTNSAGMASCTIDGVNQIDGSAMITATFAGNPNDQSSTVHATVGIY